MIVLYKKGNATDLGNWRLLFILNLDVKPHIKILTSRLRSPLDLIITSLQAGFDLGLNVSDNGFVMVAFRGCCASNKVEGVGILFDQEKVNDRVQPEYLRAVMETMQFPGSLSNSIFTLFFRHTGTRQRQQSPYFPLP